MTINERVERRLIGATQVVQPKTILRWQRAGFTTFWRWKSRYAPHGRCPYRVHRTAAIARNSKRGRCLQSSREIAAQGTADMEDHETRRKIIRQWMALPKDKRQTADQTPGLEPGTSARAESVHPRHAHGGHVAMHDAGARLETMLNTRQCPSLKIGTFLPPHRRRSKKPAIIRV